MTDSINDEAVYRTAPATPGLLKSCFLVKMKQIRTNFFCPPKSKESPLTVKNLNIF